MRLRREFFRDEVGHALMERRLVVVKRDCPARLVPTGTPVMVPGGTFVTLTQSLGGTYTIVFNGNMARIDGADADALGFKVELPTYEGNADGTINLDQVHETLRTIYDPEIAVNIVDLGLVYDCRIDPVDAHRVLIRMTLTAPGCGMGPVLVDEIRLRLKRVPNVDDVAVDLVFDPPWSRDMMTEEAQLELGLF
jgi:probable FeS assembly SUF system protein SufT